MLSQLLKPIAYLYIVNTDKRKVDWLYPIVLAALTLALLEYFLSDEYMWKSGGLVSMTLGFIQSLPGFYIAALAAVATFGKRGIDRYFPDPMPYINKKVQGEKTKNFLTRRTFLCMLFAFLTYESIILIIISIGGLLISGQPHTIIIFGFDASPTISLVSNFSYLLILYQMIAATFWGLFYLGYKIHE